MSKALVIFSGGQDSTTCLGWAKNRYSEVVAITYIYGQTHQVEVKQAEIICHLLGIPIHVFDISFYAQLIESALVGNGSMKTTHSQNPALPATFVPNRNGLFILLAHAFAQKIDAEVIITGVCQVDYSGYPDCREEFINAFGKAVNLGSGREVELLTPLLQLSKAEIFALAEKEGVLDLVIAESHTCYQGSNRTNEWGRGCGDCAACELRKSGFEEYKANLDVSEYIC